MHTSLFAMLTYQQLWLMLLHMCQCCRILIGTLPWRMQPGGQAEHSQACAGALGMTAR